MNWLDVAGPPGSGKSTICDPLWGPRDITLQKDTLLPPPQWHHFLNEITRLLILIQDHPSHTAAVRMNRRSVLKMAAVAASSTVAGKPPAYVQAGFLQRGLGFGWRLATLGFPPEELFHFLELMPVSIGVVFLDGDLEVFKQRNKAREQVRETAHENRSHMVGWMQDAIAYAKEILYDRRVTVFKYSTTEQSSDFIRANLEKIVSGYPGSGHISTVGPCGKAPPVSPPVWW